MEMVYEDTIRGLECCRRDDSCRECPYYIAGQNLVYCSTRLSGDALALIQDLERRLRLAGIGIEPLFDEKRAQLLGETLRAAVRDMKAAQTVICHICKQYYQPDPDVRRYACRLYGEFEDFDPEGACLCGAFDWRGLVEGVNDDETANAGGD